MRAWQGAIGASDYKGIVSPAYVVQRPQQRISSRYIHYLFRTPAFAKEAERWSYGITSDMWSLRPEHFKMIYCSVPSLDEQGAIVRFLDAADHRIRRYISAKLKLLKLLEEKKQVTIQGLVTKGFQEQLPFDILGRPREVRGKQNWLCATVGHLIQRGWLEIQDGNHGELHPKADHYVDDGIPFLMANDVRPSALNLETCAKISEEQANGLRIGFAKPQDVLLTHKATIGQVGIVPGEIPWPFMMLTPQVTYYRCKSTAIDPLYLFAYKQTAQFQRQIAILSSNQSTRNYIGILEQKNLVISIPDFDTQNRIVKEFQAAAQKFDAAAGKAERGIELVREFRTRLIADVVTGKLDVREAAAKLPEEAPEAEPLDEMEELPQDEGAAEDLEAEAAEVA